MNKVNPLDCTFHSTIPNYPIEDEEVFFVSDTETFDKEIKKHLLSIIEENNYKLVVLVGDILSFLTEQESATHILEHRRHINRVLYPQIFEDYNKISDESERESYGEQLTNNFVGEYYTTAYKEQLSAFASFVKHLESKSIPIVYYAGNHDNYLSPVKRIHKLFPVDKVHNYFKSDNIIWANDWQRIGINETTEIMGISITQETQENPILPDVEQVANQLPAIENPENIIFVSHYPSTEKFSKIGSPSITKLKKRYKFKLHVHGHVRRYHKNYDDHGTLTYSCNYEDMEPQEEEIARAKKS